MVDLWLLLLSTITANGKLFVSLSVCLFVCCFNSKFPFCQFDKLLTTYNKRDEMTFAIQLKWKLLGFVLLCFGLRLLQNTCHLTSPSYARKHRKIGCIPTMFTSSILCAAILKMTFNFKIKYTHTVLSNYSIAVDNAYDMQEKPACPHSLRSKRCKSWKLRAS